MSYLDPRLNSTRLNKILFNRNFIIFKLYPCNIYFNVGQVKIDIVFYVSRFMESPVLRPLCALQDALGAPRVTLAFFHVSFMRISLQDALRAPRVPLKF
jgi:hypothetical protein